MQIVVVLGAARSGTKMLRDAISANAGGFRVPYDINYVWRQGYDPSQSDELTLSDLSPERAKKIRNSVIRLSGIKENGLLAEKSFIVEKTVSNTLRVSFVHACLPDALFVHILRNGFDVVASAIEQWNTRPDLRYLLQKIRYFPISEISYAWWFIRNQFLVDSNAPSIWGPRYSGIEEDLKRLPLHIICARQWAISVSKTLKCLKEIEANEDQKIVTVKYEDICSSLGSLEGLCDDLGIASNAVPSYWRDNISKASIGKGKQMLKKKVIDDIMYEFENYPELSGLY